MTGTHPRPRRLLCRSLILAIILTWDAAAQQESPTADYLVVENVNRLSLKDRYQQTVPDAAKAGITPFTAMLIVRQSELLGDGFTPCMRVQTDGRTFFLLKDDGGEILGLRSAGYTAVFQNAVPLHDTIVILRNRSLSLSSPALTETRLLPAGEQLARLFRAKTRTYVMRLTASPSFGWVELPESKREIDWKRVEPSAAQHASSESTLAPRVRTIIDETNTTLTEIYGLLNQQTKQRRPVPQWHVEVTGSVIMCELRAAGSPGTYGESTVQLAKRLAPAVLGTPMRISSTPGRIEIR
jgi:hypothetical protein